MRLHANYPRVTTNVNCFSPYCSNTSNSGSDPVKKTNMGSFQSVDHHKSYLSFDNKIDFVAFMATNGHDYHLLIQRLKQLPEGRVGHRVDTKSMGRHGQANHTRLILTTSLSHYKKRVGLYMNSCGVTPALLPMKN